MYISLNWLNDYVDLKDKTYSEISEVLTAIGFEIEGLELKRAEIKDVVIGKVLESGKHPNADRLSLCTVSDGSAAYQVVCGAANVKAGQTIPFAKVGAVLPGDFVLRRSKIRGIESEGMICSAKELGIEPESSGIMELSSAEKAGTDAAEALGLKDAIFEVNVTPNRGDALSHLGIARELAAHYKRPLKKTRDYTGLLNTASELSDVKIEVLDTAACPRYTAQVIKGITISESPYWMKLRLFDMGLNPINNVVDITNYVLFDTGQPLHAFDLAKLAGNKIIVRRAQAGETLKLLSETEIKLTKEDLVIADAEKPLALAGVMGGFDSGVSSSSKDILLESAFFNPSVIRRTAKRFSVSTESSFRFERTIDIDNVLKSSFECAQLFEKEAGGTPDYKIKDVFAENPAVRFVSFSHKKMKHLLSLDYDENEIEEFLTDIGFSISEKKEAEVKLGIPSYRPDVSYDMDIAEEIARHVGYNTVPATMPKASIISKREGEHNEFVYDLKRNMKMLGFSEVVNYSFANPELFDKTVGNATNIDVVNELSMEQKTLRPSLLPQLVQNAKYNKNRGLPLIKLFELNRIYYLDGDKTVEREMLGGIALGRVDNLKWYTEAHDYDFFDLKGDISAFLNDLKLDFEFKPGESDIFMKGADFTILSGGEEIGRFGISSIGLARKFELKELFSYFEMHVDKLAAPVRQYIKISKQPALKRDISLVIFKDTSISSIADRIRTLQPTLVEEINVFDVFQSEKIGKDKLSVTYNVVYRSKNKTLNDKQVNKINDHIFKILQKEFGAVLREE